MGAVLQARLAFWISIRLNKEKPLSLLLVQADPDMTKERPLGNTQPYQSRSRGCTETAATTNSSSNPAVEPQQVDRPLPDYHAFS